MTTRDELNELVLFHEAFAEEMGWEQPPVMLVSDLKDQLMIYILAEGHPADALRTLEPFEDVKWVVLVSEGWTYPEFLMDQYTTEEGVRNLYKLQPPSQHPQRVEVRHVVGVTPDHVAMAHRRRGEEPTLFTDDEDELEGRVTEQLVRIVRG